MRTLLKNLLKSAQKVHKKCTKSAQKIPVSESRGIFCLKDLIQECVKTDCRFRCNSLCHVDINQFRGVQPILSKSAIAQKNFILHT